MLELAVLGLLADQPLHGYELKKRLSETLGPLWGISFGSLYPALRRLERSGTIEEVEEGDDLAAVSNISALSSGSTGSLAGDLAAARRKRPRPARRTRKAYRLTARGREVFAELLTAEDADDDRGFALKLSFCRYLSAAQRIAFLERRRGAAHRPSRQDAARPGRPHHRSLHPVAPRAPRPIHPERSHLDRRAARPRARPARRPHRRSIRMSEPTSRKKVRVAIAGVGNCSSSLVQGVEYYRNAVAADRVPGLMHVELGGYHVGDVEFVAAFDVDADKVGLDLGKAIFTSINNTIKFAEVPDLGVLVQRGPTFDGLGKYYREVVNESPAAPVDVAQALRDARADVLVSYLPVGSEVAQRHYAQACLDAGVGFVNAIPVFIASNPEWAQKFTDAGVPIIGDDIKSQVGATITHRLLARLFEDRGLAIDNTYQLNFGGNMDFKNMLERERLLSKKVSKTQSVTSQIDQGISTDSVHIGPSDHVPWLNDRKWAYIRMEGRNFGDVPLNIELKLEVWDSPNSAGVIIDAVRCAKLALDRGIGGPLLGPSAYFMKSPPTQYHDDEAYRMVEEFAGQ